MKQRKMELIMALVVIIAAFIVSTQGAHLAGSKKVEKGKKVVVIDSGHGGIDPGKIGINKLLEKDINLKIAKKLQKLLKAEGIKVIMTRNNGEGLYKSDAKNKKVEDMQKRCKIIDEVEPDLAVSIHQNSYHEESIKGAQVFYYTNSQEGEKLANIIQKQLKETLDPTNKREAKGNNSYYLLKKTKIPIVIVESGFLSNREEAELLGTDEYQQKVAWAVHLAILKYLNK